MALSVAGKRNILTEPKVFGCEGKNCAAASHDLSTQSGQIKTTMNRMKNRNLTHLSFRSNRLRELETVCHRGAMAHRVLPG